MAPDALVATRPSMNKFVVRDDVATLEVCAVARPMVCMLNRQLMLALLSRRITADVIWRKYKEHVSDLEKLEDGGPVALRVRWSLF